MCSVAPFVLPGLACGAAPVLGLRPTMAWCGYGYDADIGALLRGAVVRPPMPADLPMPSMEFLALSRRHGDHGAGFKSMIGGIQSLRVPACGLMASFPMDAHDDAAPTTPVAVLRAPRSYGDDDAERDAVTVKTPPPEKRPQQEQCGSEYDASVDATFRVMEKDPAERPVDHFLRRAQDQEEEGSAAALVRALAHHLADMALLDYRCVALLPSAVAASAIVLARLVLGYYSTAPVAGYALEDLSECMEAIYGMHENLQAWPGCDQMMEEWELTTRLRYSLPHYSVLTRRK
ncbi:hypothetical protein C2845_PM12G17710 [Panicum miliaceum]|uniref:Cyclin C-terminal domain-containing protein n=1 Tax=Panicum miliaceum TaxID=4540 RepID=A0A3L6QJD3_PANMI|nr:hypothetical protein C2845_PM12G17710 [Panicum miliaceum]